MNKNKMEFKKQKKKKLQKTDILINIHVHR